MNFTKEGPKIKVGLLVQHNDCGVMRLCSAFNFCIENYWNAVAHEVFFRIELGNFLG